ncbi:MAG: preprotein translocase subunit SecE [bacterium]|jgi:preprotein translocase SecE subunit
MATEQSDKKVRRVKNPETFREKALKASEAEQKPSKSSHVSNKLISWIFVPIKKVLLIIAHTKPVQIIWKIIRKPVRVIGLIVLPRYIRNSWIELKQVTWPDWKTSRKLTSAVIIFALIFGITVAIVDFLLDKLFKNVLLK